MAATLEPGVEHGLIGAQAHGAAEVVPLPAHLALVAARPFGHQADHRILGRAELGGGGARQAGDVAQRPRSPPSACRNRRRNRAPTRSRANWAARILPSAPRSPKPPGTRMPCTPSSRAAAAPSSPSKASLSTQSKLTLTRLATPPWMQGLDQGLVGVLEHGVLADHGDGHLAVRVDHAVGDLSASGRGPAAARR